MKQELMQSLLDKYFAGESSLQEEAQLKQLLQDEQGSAAQQQYQAWFQFLDQEAEIQLDDDFDAKIMQKIEASFAPAPVVRKLQTAWILRIAAVFALLVAGLWWMMRSTPLDHPLVAEAKVIDWSKYEPKTAEEAYQITRKAFRRVATELNEGTEIASESVGKMEEMGRMFK